MSTTLVIPQHITDKINASKDSCSTCKFLHAETDGDLVCRAHPPTAWLVGEPLPPPHPPGRIGMVVKTAFPVIESRGSKGFAQKRWCGEWQPKTNA